jgi:hypothetical protein
MADATKQLPSRADPRWREVATGKRGGNWRLLALKILMQRVLRETRADPSAETVSRCAGEVYAFFQKNASIAGADLAQIVS